MYSIPLGRGNPATSTVSPGGIQRAIKGRWTGALVWLGWAGIIDFGAWASPGLDASRLTSGGGWTLRVGTLWLWFETTLFSVWPGLELALCLLTTQMSKA